MSRDTTRLDEAFKIIGDILHTRGNEGRLTEPERAAFRRCFGGVCELADAIEWSDARKRLRVMRLRVISGGKATPANDVTP